MLRKLLSEVHLCQGCADKAEATAMVKKHHHYWFEGGCWFTSFFLTFKSSGHIHSTNIRCLLCVSIVQSARDSTPRGQDREKSLPSESFHSLGVEEQEDSPAPETSSGTPPG
jgi:hypothetical protein